MSEGREPPARDLVAALVEPLHLFADQDGVTYLEGQVDGQVQILPIHSTAGRQYLVTEFLARHRRAPSRSALVEGVAALDAIASRAVVPIGLRTAPDVSAGSFAIDLGDSSWTRVLVRPGSWECSSTGPLFRRGAGAMTLPYPTPGGSLDLLRDYVNVGDDEAWHLVLGWLVYALQPRGPYPVLVLQGEQGSCKSTTARVLVSLVDPNVAPLASVPRDDHQLLTVARSRHVYALDNLAKIDPTLKDGLCRLASGAGHTARRLYSDGEVVVWQACRPIILTGIDSLLVADDLTDRSLSVTLPAIPEYKRRPERDFWRAVEKDAPRIFGAMLDAAAHALLTSPSLALSWLPRMADFARFAAAAAPCWGCAPEDWLRAYGSNRQAAVELGLDASPLARALVAWLGPRTAWTGTAGELLGELNTATEDGIRSAPCWPRSPRGLSNGLRRLAPGLRAVGIDVEQLGRGRQGYALMIRCAPRERCERSPLLYLSSPPPPEYTREDNVHHVHTYTEQAGSTR